MRFTGTRKKTLDSRFIQQYINRTIYLGVEITDQRRAILHRIGFQNIEHGETVLPGPVGKHTEVNADGDKIVHKDLPKEKVYHMVEWEHDEWRGRDTERVTSYVDRPYKRYPRTLIPPLAKELSIYIDENKSIVISERLEVTERNFDVVLHILNIFLEIFNECNVYDVDLNIPITQLKKLNWKILPRGQFMGPGFERIIGPVTDRLSEDKRRVFWYRFKKVNRFNPAYLAIGQGGFTGYIVFAFPEKNLYVLESVLEGNATYVFNENWETLSKRTKIEILSENLQTARFVHTKNWVYKISNLLRT